MTNELLADARRFKQEAFDDEQRDGSDGSISAYKWAIGEILEAVVNDVR